ncbi:hypothetical protein DFJ77DRAFT_445117 [Powellomyces hirtus]|nr:hypothetical protein DFJ77DRAFT_445117 [Powellomyces hirtus]
MSGASLVPASPETDQGSALVLRVSLPSQEWSKAIKVYTKETIWDIKKRIMEKMASGIEDSLNWGLFLPPDVKSGKPGKFLEEKREVGNYVSENSTLLEFIPKYRVLTTASAADTDGGSPSLNSKKKQKKFVEDVVKGNVDKVRERGLKGVDPNFQTDSGDTPLVLAVMANDREMVAALLENGALTDYRLGKKDGWKTPLHVAAFHGKQVALQTLIMYGAWVNCPDGVGLPPLYYATLNSHPEAVLRLLLARAECETYDESGKGPLHLACYNNHEAIASLLIDCGAQMNIGNAVGNTPLHVAATRNAKECAKWLVLRGCEREKPNLSGQTAGQLAALSGNSDIADLIKKFTDAMIVPPPPKLPATADETSPAAPSPGMPIISGTVRGMQGMASGTHSRAASSDVSGFDPRRVSILAAGIEHPQITKSFSIQSISSVAAGTAKREPSAPSRRRTSSRTSKSRKSVNSERYIPPPPSTPRVPSAVPSDVAAPTSTQSPAPNDLPLAPTLSPMTFNIGDMKINAAIAASENAAPAIPPPKILGPGFASFGLPPPPSQPPQQNSAAQQHTRKPSVPSRLQFVAPPPPRSAPPPKSAPLAPIVGSMESSHLSVMASVSPEPTIERRRSSILESKHAKEEPSTSNYSRSNYSSRPTSVVATRSQAHQIISMLQSALHGDEDLEVDLEILLDGFGAMEKALDESEWKCRELEKMVARLREAPQPV